MTTADFTRGNQTTARTNAQPIAKSASRLKLGAPCGREPPSSPGGNARTQRCPRWSTIRSNSSGEIVRTGATGGSGRAVGEVGTSTGM